VRRATLAAGLLGSVLVAAPASSLPARDQAAAATPTSPPSATATSAIATSATATWAPPLVGDHAEADRVAVADGVWPLDPPPEVIREFERPASTWGPGHRGVDLRGRVGQPVRAARAGTVTFVGRIAGRGVVVVSHGPTRTTYEPVAAEVAVGDAVGRGGRVGHLELAGSHCLPRACLHWGVLADETYLDPLTLVGAVEVRLLPWLDGARSPVGGLPGVLGRWARSAGVQGVGRAAVPQLPSWRPVGEAALFRS
jgi:murein DD-endopeptidase MepM/ murein hydrolase activator NlpD